MVSQRTFKRRETAIEDQLEIAELALAEEQRRQSLSLGGKLGMAGQIAGDQVLEDAAVGRVRHLACVFCSPREFEASRVQQKAANRSNWVSKR